MSRTASRFAALAAAVTVTSAVPVQPVRACGNGFEIRVDPRTGAVSEAERLVSRGKSEDAARMLLRVDRSFATAKPGKSLLGDRALLVLAKSVARSDGRIAVGDGQVEQRDAAREQNLAWAVDVTRTLAAKRSDDPSIASDLGEVLSLVPKEHAESRRVLEALEKRDVIASPYAYAALARLRGQRAEDAPAFVRAPLRAFEAARRELEISRCEAMTKDPSICRASVGS